MDYSAGDLQVKILGSARGATTSINSTIKALERLSNALTQLNGIQSLSVGLKLENLFESIARATNSINVENINKLTTSARALSSISRIGNLDKVDFTRIGQGFSTLTTAITPFIDKVKTAEVALVSLYRIMMRTQKEGSLLGAYPKEDKQKKGGFFGALGKITTVYFVARRLGSAIAKIAQAGADYTETLNLWETAMTRNLDKATQFVDKMSEAYGISEKTLMNAQATFKNMLGSLGQISEDVAYQLSEGVTQMAVDYASLYNVTFEKAFEKFQSALAGQVRPIRSVSGYDITENTIYELYKQLGGEKSVRNLSRTEKQLLAILAVFNQMQASGAIGDLNKTMESYANQSRVMAEAWSELVSYSGILLTHLIQESGILTTITANLMVVTDILKAVVEEYGAIKSFGGDIFGGTEQSADNASNAIDELNGKLADFDKFRALNESEETEVRLDSIVANALSKYESVLENAGNSARELAKHLKAISGFFKEDGSLDLDKWNSTLASIASILGVIFAVLTSLAVFNIFKLLVSPIGSLALGIGTLVSSITTLVQVWDKLTAVEQFISIFMGLAYAIFSTAAAISVMKAVLKGNFGIKDLITAIGIGMTIGGIALGVSANHFAKNYANGGLPDKGTMFVAGEAGAEMVYNMPSGQSGVANIQQIAQANYNGTIKALNDWWGGMSAKQDIPKLQGANATGLYQAVTGVAKAQGERWGKY